MLRIFCQTLAVPPAVPAGHADMYVATCSHTGQCCAHAPPHQLEAGRGHHISHRTLFVRARMLGPDEDWLLSEEDVLPPRITPVKKRAGAAGSRTVGGMCTGEKQTKDDITSTFARVAEKSFNLAGSC